MDQSEPNKRVNSSVLLTRPDFSGPVTIDWFDPRYWGKLAQPVSSGGRGSAWFIDTGNDPLVLREYRRGGFVSRFAQTTYVYTGEESVRSVAEFRLLNQLERLGLPVPRAIAACYTKVFPFRYRASILIERLCDTVPLADVIRDLRQSDWSELGRTIRLFHDQGVRHADLNCFNVLVRDATFFLIDFDKGQLMAPDASHGWKRRNLERFARSLKKVAGDAEQHRVWDSFMTGYNGGQAA
jgi:3-deoxy-D-manno-octulosonic acid kinase